MAETTSIGWCDATINFWHGCKKVSEGCKFCYMYRDKDRYGIDGSIVLQTKASTIRQTLKALIQQDYERKKSGNLEPMKIFTCSWSDFFIDEADNWREEAWQVIREHPQFIWIILTKRIDRAEECLPKDWGTGWDNVWLCVSAENQQRWDERVPVLIRTPAKVRGVSIEPMIGYVNIRNWIRKEGECPQCLGDGSILVPGGGVQCPTCLYEQRNQMGEVGIDWIIIGGESGNDNGYWKYRPAEMTWFLNILHDCEAMKIPVFVKQLGTHIAGKLGLKSRAGDKPDQWPKSLYLNIQQFPGDKT